LFAGVAGKVAYVTFPVKIDGGRHSVPGDPTHGYGSARCASCAKDQGDTEYAFLHQFIPPSQAVKYLKVLMQQPELNR
jgi:hypothetical protein